MVLVDREVGLLLEQLQDGLVPLVGPLQEPLEDLRAKSMLPSWIWSSRFVASFLNSSTSAFQEVELLRVEILEEIVAPLDGDLVVDHRPSHVPPLEQIDHGLGRLLVLVGGDGRLAPTTTAMRARMAISVNGRNASRGMRFGSVGSNRSSCGKGEATPCHDSRESPSGTRPTLGGPEAPGRHRPLGLGSLPEWHRGSYSIIY